MTAPVRADLDHLAVLVSSVSREADELAHLREQAAWAVSSLRSVSREPTIRLTPSPIDVDLARLEERVRVLGSQVRDVAEAIVAADAWRHLAGGARWVDETVTVRLHELPGLGGVPAPELREVTGLLLNGARTMDELGADRIGDLQRTVVDHATDATRAAGRYAARFPGRALIGRASDVLGSPWAVRARAVGGRAVGVVGVAVDAVEGVERAADGDGWGAARSLASAGGGALMLTAAPVAVGVGALVVGGVLVYENREALGRTLGGAARASRDGARRAARAVSGAAGDVADGARDVIDGARRLVGGLF